MRKFLLDIRSGALDAETNYQTFLLVTGAAVQEHMKVFTLFPVQISPFILFVLFKQARRCEQWAQNIYSLCEGIFLTSVSVFCAKSELISRAVFACPY
jgi:hypothetical protein